MIKKRVINVVGCFLKYEGKFLVMLRATNKKHAGAWGLVAGKVNEGDTKEQAVVREVKEETGLDIPAEKLQFLFEYSHDAEYGEDDNAVINFCAYKIELDKPVEIKFNPDEHEGYKWVTLDECYEMPGLIVAFKYLLDRVRKTL